MSTSETLQVFLVGVGCGAAVAAVVAGIALVRFVVRYARRNAP